MEGTRKMRAREALALLALSAVVILPACDTVKRSATPENPPPATPAQREISWDEAVRLIRDGQVRSMFQSHSQEVELVLKDGSVRTTVEPRIDDVLKVIQECGRPCGGIQMAIE